MASWNCSDHHNSPLNVVSASEHGCGPLSMCTAAQQRHLCVVPTAGGGAWTVGDPSSPRPVAAAGPVCPQAVVAATSVCPQRLMMKVHPAPYLDASDDVMFCRTSRFPTSVTVDTSSPCRNSATCQEPCYNPGMCTLRHSENSPNRKCVYS